LQESYPHNGDSSIGIRGTLDLELYALMVELRLAWNSEQGMLDRRTKYIVGLWLAFVKLFISIFLRD